MARDPFAGYSKGGGGGGKKAFGGYKRHRPEKPKSLFGQIGELIEEAPSGLLHFARETVTDPIASTLTGAMLAGGQGALVGAGVGAIGTGAEYLKTGEGPDFKATKELGASLHRTSQRLGDLVTGDISRYQKASRQGHIVGAVLEDVGNVSIFASGVSRGLNAASRGAVAEATAARETAEAAAKAAQVADDAAAAARTAAGAAPDAAAAARVLELDDAARAARTEAGEWAAKAQAATDKAGPLLRAYHVAHSVENLGAQGAMLPAKPWVWSAKLVAKPVRAFLNSDIGAPLKQALERVSTRLTNWSVGRRYIEKGQTDEVRLGIPAREAAGRAEAVLPDETAQHAALIDLEGTPEATQAAVSRLRASGMDDVADQLEEAIVSDPELGLTPEAWELARKVADGTLEQEDPGLYARIREFQQIHREEVQRPATGRFVSQYGTMDEPTEARGAYREWSVEGTEPNPTRMAATERKFDVLEEQTVEALGEAVERAERLTGRRLLPEGMTVRQAVQHDLDEAVRVSRQAVARAMEQPELLAQLREYLGLHADAAPEAIVTRLTKRILQARRDPALAADPVMAAATAEGQFVAPSLRSLDLAEPTAAERASTRADVADQQVSRLGAMAERAERQGFNEAAGPVSRLGQEPRPVSGRRLGRAEGKEAAFGALMDEAFGKARRERTRAATAPEAAARRQGAQQGRAMAEGVRAGRREAAADAALREVGIRERVLARIPERRARALERTAAELKSAPARYRPAIIVSRKAEGILGKMAAEADELAPGAGDVIAEAMAELPTTLKQMVDAGIEPDYVIHGELPHSGGTGRPRPSLTMPQRRATGEEKIRTQARGPRNIREVHQLQMRRLRAQVENETARRMIRELGTRADAVLGRSAADLGIDVEQRGPITPDQRARDLGYVRVGEEKGAETRYLPVDVARGGEAAQRAMREAGYVAWNGKPRGVGATGEMTAKEVGPTTVYIPRQMYESFGKYFGENGKAEQAFRRLYDRPMRAWKASVLALTFRWHIGNMIGNAVLGTLGAGINPIAYTRRIIEARDLMRRTEAGERGLIDPALTKRSLTSQELVEMEPARTRLGRFIQRSYNFNGMVDDLNRVAIWLEETERLTDRDLFAYKAKYPELATMSKEQIRNEAAIRLSLRAAGDFTRMTPLERQVLRRAFPFYAWLRHITSLAVKMPVYAPLRTVWFLHLSDLFGEPAEFPFLEGSVPLGGMNFLMLPKINPFSDSTELGSGNPLAKVTQSLTPAIKSPFAMFGGLNLDTLTQVSRAPGSTPLDAYGRETSGPLTFGQDLYQLANLFPQARLARQGKEAITEGGIVQRYQSGQPVRVRGQTMFTSKGTLGSLYRAGAQFGGLPYVSPVDVRALQVRRLQREIDAAKSRIRYNAGGGGGGSRSSGGRAFAGYSRG